MLQRSRQRELLFSVTAKDCDWQTMTAGGPGGQHQNRSQTAVRCTHRASGATGTSREFKSQIQNKRAAFRHMASQPAFQAWVRRTAAALGGEKSLDQQVDESMQPEFLRIESFDARRQEWIRID